MPIPAGARASSRPIERARKSRAQRGQALVEFALLVPLMVLLAVALGDYGRLYSSAITVESAAREAADYGAFQGSLAWDSANSPWTTLVDEMRRRACTAASTLADYQGAANNSTCSNPSFQFFPGELQANGGPANCADAKPVDASPPTPCVIHVRMTYDFHMFITFFPLPPVFHMTRDSWYSVSDLGL